MYDGQRSTTLPMAALKGKALLEYLDQHTGEERDKVIEGAGYSVKRNGKPSLQRTKFFEALAAANGHQLASTIGERPEGFGKDATYRLKVGPKGLVPVSRAYTVQCNMEPGAYVKVIIEDGVIILEPEEVKAAACTPPVAQLASVA
jgi:hypothetical protein